MNRRRAYSKGQWAVARERFQIAELQPPAPDLEALPLGNLIPAALKNLKLDVHAQVAQIAAAWPEIVGPQLAANTRPGRLENQLLTVFVTHPGWLFELHQGGSGAEILARVQARFGKKTIQNIRWAIDPEPPAAR